VALAGVGDCVLLNFATGLFALSDSSDRAPGQSREFLRQFDRMVSTSSAIRIDQLVSAPEIRGIAENMRLGCERILQSIQGLASCTFTGVQIVRTHIGMHAFLFHTGDSCLYEYDRSKRTLSALTVKNFWMIGKTAKLYQTSEFSVRPETVFILATDGATGGTDERTQERKIAEIARYSRVEDIPDKIMQEATPVEGFRDDAAVIALSTQGLKHANTRIIMGGTTALQETEYAERCRSGFYTDSSVSLMEKSAWRDHVF